MKTAPIKDPKFYLSRALKASAVLLLLIGILLFAESQYDSFSEENFCQGKNCMSSVEALFRAFVYSPVLAIYLCVSTNLGFVLFWLYKAFRVRFNNQISTFFAPIALKLKSNPMIKKYWIPLGVLLSLFINLLVSARSEEPSTIGTIVMVLSVWLIPGLFLYLVIQLMIAAFRKVFAKKS